MSFSGAVVGGAVSAIVFALIQSGFRDVRAFADGGNTVITGNKDGSPFRVALANDGITGAQYDIVEIDTGTTQLTKPARPNYSLQNPQDTDKRVFALGIVPDSTFKSEGIIEIFINKVRVFPITDPEQGFLSSVTSLNIPIPANFGLKIKPRDKVEVFVWNPSGNSAKVNFAIFVGDIT